MHGKGEVTKRFGHGYLPKKHLKMSEEAPNNHASRSIDPPDQRAALCQKKLWLA